MDSLFEETPEEEASELRTTPVEAEGELVKVALEVISLHRSLMSTKQPPLYEARNAVRPRKGYVRLNP